jgi:hypothetical protein
MSGTAGGSAHNASIQTTPNPNPNPKPGTPAETKES